MFGRLFGQLRRQLTDKPQPAADASGALEFIRRGQQAELHGDLGEALRCYQSALQQLPDSAELYAMYGNLLRAMHRDDEAILGYRKACELQPKLIAARYNLALAEHQTGDLESAERHYRAALAADPGLVRAHSSLLCLVGMGYAGGRARGPSEVLAEHREWDRRHALPLRASLAPFANTFEAERRLRVGYVSADLREHAVACFVEPLLAHHDRQAFEVICYDNSVVRDATNSRLRGLADGWREIADIDDAAAAQLVRADGIDLLIDLGGHTQDNRLLMFARKPSPVQITYLGYPNSTGLTAMDYRISDFQADPPGMTESSYVERLLRLPHSMWCYRPFDGMPAILPRPGGEGGVVFGSMNSCIKLNTELLKLWARLLHQVADSRLLLAAVPQGSAQQRVLKVFAGAGIAANRVECVPRLDNAGFWALHQRVDIALDSFPMNGGTTTCETLWMGVPVVTLKGSTFASRAGCSLLSAAGFTDWIADTPEAYLNIAAGLARDAGGRAGWRANMRGWLRRSALLDGAAVTRDLERLYRDAWRTWCAAQSQT